MFDLIHYILFYGFISLQFSVSGKWKRNRKIGNRKYQLTTNSTLTIDGLSENSKKQVQNDQESELILIKKYLETGRWWGNNEDKNTIEYLAKYILANYEIDF
jgi:hypothetical protein